MRPIVLAIAGSDPCGGAGIQGDLKAIEACGGWAATVVTAITSQNSQGVSRSDVLAPEVVVAQLLSVFSDLDVRAVKSGMLGDAAVVGAVAAELGGRAPRPYVLDPVLSATGGHSLLTGAGRDALVAQLFPLASLVTPNAHEAALLADLDLVEDQDQAERAGRRLIERGARAVLVKGGHLERARGTDVLVTPSGSRAFRAPALAPPRTHGGGCALASAIATELAHGRTLEQAIERAKGLVQDAIRNGVALGAGRGAVDVFGHREGTPAGRP